MTLRTKLCALLLVLPIAITQAQLKGSVELMQAASGLLPLRKVQTHLKVTKQQQDALKTTFKWFSDQAKQIQRTAKSPQEAGPRAQKLQIAAANRALGVLTITQRARLKQLALQAYGPFSVMAPDIAKELKLTPAQLSSLRKVQAGTIAEANKVVAERARVAATVPKPKNQNDRKQVEAYFKMLQPLMEKRAASDKKRLDKIKADGEAKVLKVLSASQRAQWQAMLGPKFAVN